MKRLLLFFAAMCCMMVAKAQTQPDNEIWYVSSEKITPNESAFDATIESNDYDATSQRGIIKFNTEALTKVGERAFYDCDNLTSIILPHSVTEIGKYAFYSSSYLASITLPSSLEIIANQAFEDCYELTSITLPNGLKSIGEEAFYACEKLTSINIPSSVTSIGECAFCYCEELSSISVDEGNTTYDSRDNCNAIIETATNTLIQGSSNTVIPSSVTAIGDFAFYYCEKITSITLPDGLKSIGYDAFGYCTDLESITIPGSVESIDESAFCSCENLESVTLSNGLKSIGYYAFGDCEKLTSITIPSTVTEIGDAAFEWCTKLTSITVLASTPPTLGGGKVFYDVPQSITVYVPDVDAYSSVSWGGFNNFHEITIDKYKQLALDEIDAAMSEVTLSAEEEAAINGYINTIKGVTTSTDDYLAAIETAKNAALAIISQAIIRNVREAAIAAIEAAMQGETSDYLTGLVQEYIDIINSATDETVINNAKNTALVALNAAVEAYKAGKGDAFGSLGEKQNGPALIVTDKDDKEIILYSPKSVEYIKVNEK